MIVESKAIEPKAGSATSVYPAVIVNLDPKELDTDDTETTFVHLQVFCPDVMSGSVTDAKYATNNWIEAPRGPHSGVFYDFQIGGVITISYQNGNISMPQFIRYVPVNQAVIDINRKYVEGAPVTADDDIFDIGDTDTDITSPGIQKGRALLPALMTCNPNILFHTYGYDNLGLDSALSGQQYLTIYRCGKFGVELVYRVKNNSLTGQKPQTANFDYLENIDSSWLSICQRLLTAEQEDGTHSLIDVVNATIIAFEDNQQYKRAYIDKTNEANILYWYTKMAGYIYDVGNNYDKSMIISPSLTQHVKENKLTVDMPPEGSKTWKALNYTKGDSNTTAISMYKGTMRTDNTFDTERELTFGFITEFYKQLNKNSFFSNQMATAYSIILNRNLFSIRQTYNATAIYNKYVMICALIASAFPVLKTIIANFDVSLGNDYTDKVKEFAQAMKQGMQNESGKLTAREIATNFTLMYFQTLGGWEISETTPPHTTRLFMWDYDPAAIIYNQMLLGINYIFDNYNQLKSTLDDNTSSPTPGGGSSGGETGGGGSGDNDKYAFIWPIPGVSKISSPYGYRVINGVKDFHTGVDITGNCYGKPVVATANGKVVKVVNRYLPNQTGRNYGYGNYVKIQHNSAEGIYSLYAHLKDVTVNAGDIVTKGQTIGHCDNTGWSTGSHLHFEIHINNATVNPLNYVSY